MPAALLATLCLTPRLPPPPPTRLRPVPSVVPGPRTWLEEDEYQPGDSEDGEPAP